MKSIFTILVFLAFSNFSKAQSWTACGLNVNNNSTSGTSLCVHNGKLFASNQNGIYVSTDLGNTFNQINTALTSSSKMLSTGNRLYVVTSSFGCSDIWFSTNDGMSFQQDTIGLPICSVVTGRRPSLNGKAWNNHLVISLDGPDWEWSKSDADTNWTDASYFDANDCSEFFVKNDTCWAATNGATSNGLAWSTDGINWTSPNSTGIPNYYVPAQIVWNGNRVLMSGSDLGAGAAGIDTILKYSDDYGLTFQEINIKQYLDGYAFFSYTGKQPILDMYSGYGHIFCTLGQDVLETAPELIVSKDNGLTFEKDTVGFPTNVLGTVFVINEMAFLQGWAFAQVNSGDVYKKQLTPSAISTTTNNLSKINIYPNPATTKLSFTGNDPNKKYSICIKNLLGHVIYKSKLINNSVDIQQLNRGYYLCEIISDDDKQTLKFIKE